MDINQNENSTELANIQCFQMAVVLTFVLFKKFRDVYKTPRNKVTKIVKATIMHMR